MNNEIESEDLQGEGIIENFGALPTEEQARLVARQEANEWAAIERMREEDGKLSQKLERLKILVARQRAYADKLESVLREMRTEKQELAREEALVLAL